MNFKNWNGQDLKGEWLFTLKIDGVQAKKQDIFEQKGKDKLWKGFEITSKGGKKLNHLPALKGIPFFGIAEIFCGSWNNTMSIVMASKSKRRQVKRSEIYPLYPNIDPRLVIGTFTNPTARLIRLAFEQALAEEYEGLVLRQGDTFIKVKPEYTEDVKITGWTEGKGKFKGMLGKLHTELGDVGTGFTNLDREEIWDWIHTKNNKAKGTVIEVKSMEKTSTGKLRHPRFIRLRLDKA